MPVLQEFWEQLNRGPAALFLGQGYLSMETGSDPLLVEIQGRFGGADTIPSYDLLLAGAAGHSGDAALTWIYERCRRLSPPEWLQLVAQFPWSCVFSSAIDSSWVSAFRNEWREVAQVYGDDYFPGNPRNRRVLNCSHLFGSVNQTEPKLRPPLTRFEMLNRRQASRNLAQRLPDVVTPLGLLAIEGYKVNDDWFPLDDFFPVLQSMGSGQAHLFSVDHETENHPVISELVRASKLVLHPEGLAWALEQGSSQGFIQFGSRPEWEASARNVPLRDRSIPIPKDLWNRVNDSATIIDAHMLGAPAPISSDALYWEFRRFLLESGIRPLWSGFARDLAFPREFEKGLTEKTLKRLDGEESTDDPIVVHGQTGTGKTIALGSLAYRVAKSGKQPVIFIERKPQRPVYADIDECCRWFEDHGADATLVVWDGMVQQSDYHEIQGYLASRGRKAVVVGSSYKLKESGSHLVEVPDLLSPQEAKRFADFLSALGISLNERHREALESRDPNYLVALYRHLAPTRPQITSGIVQELEQLENEFVQVINHSLPKDTPLGSLAVALLSAGLIDRARIEETALQTAVHISPANAAELVDIVTVPGRFGLNIPIELLARAWGMADFSGVAPVLKGFDLIYAIEDLSGRVVVGPRHPLEAHLIVQARLGNVQNEAAIVSRIVKAVRPARLGADENDEIGFAIELLRAVGPQGDERGKFAPFFRELAGAISEVRESRNIKSPRLMLQEANFLREWVTALSQQGTQPEDAIAVLNKAQSILEEALEILEGNPRQWRLMTFIATELASTFGAATVDSIYTGASMAVVREKHQQVLGAVQTARSKDFSSYNPVDILVWSTSALLRHPGIDEVARIEAVTDVLDALETVDPGLLDSGNRVNFHRRRMEVGNLIDDRDLSESAFQNLLELGSAAGFYLRAREMGGSPADPQKPTPMRHRQYQEAWDYLERHRSLIAHDSRCLNLLFDYWWLSKTGHRLFDAERVGLPFTGDDWRYGLQLIRELKALSGSHRGLTMLFLEAIALFHLRQLSPSLQLFKEVENESYKVPSRRRILRSFLASEPSGTPSAFQGNVQWVDPGGRRGQVFVNELRQLITFFPADFGRPGIQQGDALGEFHIAFNFINPIADPPSRSRA